MSKMKDKECQKAIFTEIYKTEKLKTLILIINLHKFTSNNFHISTLSENNFFIPAKSFKL